MSSLIYFIDKSQVLVATDTLAVSYDEHTPFMFQHQGFYRAAFENDYVWHRCCWLFVEWFIKVNHNMVVVIDALTITHPDNLGALWAEFRKILVLLYYYNCLLFRDFWRR